ncbi:MAG: HlyD family type I secretion periplasmic adaptor subunit [Pseudomonadota bacterium]|nr:HlyD family type I secretion periplasmic adaptor subunit [Pseudomonadota bacterium]
MTDLNAQIETKMKGPSLTIWLSAISVWAFILWASFAWVDEIVRADGEFVSSSRPQIIQNLEGGILSALLVKEGEEVMQGDVLARLHGTMFQSSVDDIEDQITALEIRRLRLEAELAGASGFDVPAIFAESNPAILASERSLLRARQQDFVSRRDGAKRILEQAATELKLMENLYSNKVVALIEVTQARKTYADAKLKHDEFVTQTELARAEEFSETLKELATLKQNLKASTDQLQRTVLVSPVRGVVNKLSITTIGGVVRPGEEILQIIPIEEELLVEAKVAPENIANIRPGQEATIKLSAYDYTIYGTIKGRVDVISADTFKDERDPDGESHYKVTVRVDPMSLSDRQSMIDLRPGMQAQVELMTGEKTVLQYLLKPLYKTREALREP